MKRLLTCCLLAGLCAAAAAQTPYQGTDPAGTVSYSLPLTTLHFEVEARQELFHAGPYARFAGKYLGMDVRLKDEQSWQVTSVQLGGRTEADLSRRFSVEIGTKGGTAAFLGLCSQGLVSLVGMESASDAWCFPAPAREGDFAAKGAVSPLETASATLYGNTGGKDFHQEMVVGKSLEKQAAETAQLIHSLRSKRIQIVTGDTDANYSGDAMRAALDEMKRLEEDYLVLFTGYTETRVQRKSFELTPDPQAASQTYIAFRLSEADGLVGADNLSGKPVVLKLDAVKPAEAPSAAKASAKVKTVVYRIPAICRARLTHGTELLLETRVPVFQLGTESLWPLNLQTQH